MFEENQLSEVISLGHIYIRTEAEFKDQIIDEAVGHMAEEGLVRQEFLLSVYKREGMMTTRLSQGIAIPHGDPGLVTKPVISVTKLDKPVLWDGVNTVDVIFILGIQEDSRKYFEQLYQIISMNLWFLPSVPAGHGKKYGICYVKIQNQSISWHHSCFIYCQKGARMMDIEKFPKVTVILRGYTYSQTRTVVRNLVGTCLGSVEITMNTPGALESIRKISQEFGAQIMVGAGTVLTYEEAVEAIEAGAAFLLSPTVFERRILDLCRERGVVSVPGAFSPSEIRQSFLDGADIVKIFPAGRLGSGYVSDIQAPLGKMPLMVVGGIGTSNVQEYFAAGASFAGIGSGIS